ncbi:MAG TPA: carboxypeptidase-like regulatory domain-containing protein, partial [Kofleriaceae bacterium]|nr:carboxypeptidase-like regulatory domain-containing protein [Kofleriaceae bacterium]
VVRAPGYVAAAQQVTVRSGRGMQDATFDLVRGATLAGEVRDRFGRRVAGAKVSIGDVSTVTDGNGEFRLSGVESGTLAAESEGTRAALDLRLAPGDERLSLTLNLSE